MKFSFFILFPIMLLLSACGETEQERAQQQEREMQMQMQMVETTPEFNGQMAAVLDRYFDLKDALVGSDAEQAKMYADSLRSEAVQVDPAGLNEETTALWLSFSEVIVNSSDELIPLDDVDDQRYHFEFISEAMIDMVDLFRPVGFDVYHQSCPMVRGGTADWLSREEQIANPYHGDRMMRCGEVIRRL
jgi:membrane fusion protein, copper/silver efflux system